MNNLKRIRLSKEAKAAIVLTIATFLCKGINIITTPIFTRLLTSSEMGVVTTYNSWYTIIYTIASLSLDSGSFNIAMMEFKDDRYGYMSSILCLSTFSSCFIGIIYFLFHDFFNNLFGLNNELMSLMLISFVFLPATTFWMLHQRYEYKYKSTALVTMLSTGVSTVFSAVITFLFSVDGKYNLPIIKLGSSNLVLIIWGIFFYCYIMLKGKKMFSKKYLYFVISVNTPLLVHSFAKQILDISDRTMISYLVGKRAVGIYGVLYSVSALALIVWTAINSSLVPFMFENLKKENYSKISVFVENMLLVYGIACIVITLFAPEILRVLATAEYFEGIYMMPPIAAGIFFTSLYNIYSNVLLYYKKTGSIMVATSIAAIINILLNFIFIQLYGYQAAAYTTLISYIFLAFIQYYMLKKQLGKISIFNNKKIWGIAIITCVICVAINLLYIYIYIRYIIILIIILMMILCRKKILDFLKCVFKRM